MAFPATWGCASDIYPSVRWARRGIVVPFVRSQKHSFGYYTNMVHQIKFIQTFNPSRELFFTQGQGHVMLPMSMEMTCLDFQLSTDNQNGCQLATKFFFLIFFSELPRNLVYIYSFSGSVSLLVLSVFL